MIIEKTIKDYLDMAELGADVYTEIPKSKPEAFYSIEKTGSSMRNHIKQSTVAVQSWAKRMYDAMAMNEEVKQAMIYGLISLDSISRVELNSDYNFTDVSTGRYRYQAVFVITHY